MAEGKYDRSALLTTASMIDNFNIIITDKKNNKSVTIAPNYIVDCEVKYGDFVINGYVTFKDHYDLETSMNLSNDLTLTIQHSDIYSQSYKREFKIIDSKKNYTKNIAVITYKFQDIVSYTLQKTHAIKAYNGMASEFVELVKQVLDEYIKPKVSIMPEVVDSIPQPPSSGAGGLGGLVNSVKNVVSKVKSAYESFTNKTIFVTTTNPASPTASAEKEDPAETNFIITANRSLFDIIMDNAKQRGVYLYQTKSNIVVLSADKLSLSSMPSNGISFANTEDDPISGRRILEYKVNDGNKADQLTKSQAFAYDNETKTLKMFSGNVEDRSDIQQKEMQESSSVQGVEYIEQGQLTQDNLMNNTLMSFITNGSMDIVIPGHINHIESLYRCSASIGGVSNSEASLLVGEVKKSGDYVVIEYSDKILNGYFLQKVKLGRADNTDYSGR